MNSPLRAPGIRDPWLDNARFILIALVAFGHLLEPLLDAHPWLAGGYRFIYAFHMPAFAFLSGAVAHDAIHARLLRSTTFRLLWPYLVFQGLYALAALAPAWPDAGPGSITTPYWLLWYLLSLACWRLMLPLFAHLRHRLLIAVLMALAAGCLGGIGYYLSLSRTLVFFPLFLMGWQWAPRWRAYSQSPRARLLAVGALAGVFAAALYTPLSPRWLYGSYGYAALDTGMLAGVGLRLLLLGIAATCTLAFLALVPRRHTLLSAPGSRSLGAYVLQGFVIKLAIGTGAMLTVAQLTGASLVVLLAAASIVLTGLLSSRPMMHLLEPVTTPRWLEKWLWRESVTHVHDTS